VSAAEPRDDQRGTHFDPDVVDAFVAVEHDIEALSKTLAA
jgi:response regulator RpfG family c-di-GMP phosphodiesterase